MYNEVLANRVRELKETEKGVELMCREMEQIYSEGIENGIEEGIRKGIEKGRQEGRKEGCEEGQRDAAISMASGGMGVDKIAGFLNVSVQKVQEWISEGRS